eukprot:2211267-Rhodomonas_salina.2
MAYSAMRCPHIANGGRFVPGMRFLVSDFGAYGAGAFVEGGGWDTKEGSQYPNRPSFEPGFE